MIGGGKFENFWKAHTKSKGIASYYSDEFKDMITSMLMLDPNKRLTMDQVMDHPWYTNPDVPSSDEVMAEFFSRKKILEDNLRAEREAKLA